MMTRPLRRMATAGLIGVGLLTQASTGWLIEPHRMWIAESLDGRDLVHFERSVPVPLFLRAQSHFVADADGARWCEHSRFTWFLPNEAAEQRATPWPPRCETPPPAGDYRIYARISLCLWELCARPARFISDAIAVTPAGRYLPAGATPAAEAAAFPARPR